MNLTNALGWTLVHFLWQGAFIAILLPGALALFRKAGPRARYAASCAALLLMLVCAVVTFVVVQSTRLRSWPETAGPLFPRVAAEPGGVASYSGGSASNYLPVLVWAWLAGVAALSIRSLGGWAMAQRFARRHTGPPAANWEERFAVLVKRLTISRPVRLAVSSWAEVPAVVGWVRPVVLLPVSVFTGLAPEQIEGLLAHELAHVRRHDYLVNLLQTAAETLFFYHPAVWWVSRNMRHEREHCCDDLAVQICGSTVAYARALTQLEVLRRGTSRLAIAADGGSLRARVQRLLETDSQVHAAPSVWGAGVAIAAAVLAAGISSHTPFTLRAQPGSGAVTAPRAAARPSEAEAKPALKNAEPGNPAPNNPEPNKESPGWLDEIQAEGFRDLNVDHLIAMKIHGVTASYIREIRAAGMQPDAEQLVAFRIHGVTAEFIRELKQAGLRDLTAGRLVALRIHGVDPPEIRELQSLGYRDLSSDQLVALRIHGVTPAFIREAQRRGFSQLSPDRLIQLKRLGILKTPEMI